MKKVLVLIAVGLSACGGGGENGGGDGGTSGSPDGGSTSSGAKLPATAFVFVRTVRADSKALVAYDTATQTETVLTNLDDDTAGILRLDVSPDRSRVAFTAEFRPGANDAVNPSEIL